MFRLTRFFFLIVILSFHGQMSGQRSVEKNVVIGMVSGLALVMDVYYPENPNGYGIVHVSGSGFARPLAYNAQPLSERQVDIWGLPLVEQGYTVFSLNHRAIPRFQWPDPLHDVQRAVRYVRYHASEYGIDPDSIGAVGGSSGGVLVTALGVLDGKGDANDPDPINRVSGKVQTIVIRASHIDFNQSNNEAVALLMGSRSARGIQDSEEWRIRFEASPINHVSQDDPPMLMIVGDKDPGVPVEHLESMQSKLDAAGVESEVLVIPGAAHGPDFPGATNPPDYIGKTLRWFDTHLKK